MEQNVDFLWKAQKWTVQQATLSESMYGTGITEVLVDAQLWAATQYPFFTSFVLRGLHPPDPLE